MVCNFYSSNHIFRNVVSCVVIGMRQEIVKKFGPCAQSKFLDKTGFSLFKIIIYMQCSIFNCGKF